jgi:hypothetical protein
VRVCVLVRWGTWWFGGVLPSGRGGPAEGSRGDLLHFPAGVLLEAVVVAAGRPAVAQA